MKTHAGGVLSDFFANQDFVVLAGATSDTRFDPTYVPTGDRIELRVLAPRCSTSNEVVNTAHEIAHFVTVCESRLGLQDYGYKISLSDWSAAAWLTELDVIARQVVILRYLRRHKAAREYLDNLSSFLRKSGAAYLETVTGMGDVLSLGTSIEDAALQIRRLHDHVDEAIDTRIDALSGGYAGIVDEFHRRIATLSLGARKAAA